MTKCYIGKRYNFTEQKIETFKNNQLFNTVVLEDIEEAYYRSFRFRYIFTIFLGELIDGGAWKLHIKLKNGEKRELGFFDKKDITKIKELYSDLIQIKVL